MGDATDAQAFFNILTERSGRDSGDVNTFVVGCIKLRGDAKAMDLFMLHDSQAEMHSKLELLSEAHREAHSKLEKLETLQHRVRDIHMLVRSHSGHSDLAL